MPRNNGPPIEAWIRIAGALNIGGSFPDIAQSGSTVSHDPSQEESGISYRTALRAARDNAEARVRRNLREGRSRSRNLVYESPQEEHATWPETTITPIPHPPDDEFYNYAQSVGLYAAKKDPPRLDPIRRKLPD